jgi:predicted transposase/invertase (TIGR01784 family)
MITDPLFYRLFETSPETFFLLLGLPIETARETAARYRYQAIEFKETAHRVDGVFLPKEPGLPLYFLEVQFYPLPSVFADLLVKVFTYLKQHDPAQDFVAVVLFAGRSLEPPEAAAYRPLFDAGLIRRFYLDEMQQLPDAPLGLSILYLIRQVENQAPEMARDLVARAKAEIADAALRADLIEFIETIIMYKVPRLTRE